jgi:hypothetical protein
MANLFVSYARADQAIVQSLVGELRELGHDPFYDQNLTGGQRWWDVLLDRIQVSDGFLPVLSEDYRKSEACHLEAEWAQKLGIGLLPIDLGRIGPELCASFIAESNWVRYSLDDRTSVARLARAIGSLSAPELPDPLPERPAIPISYLAATEREIRTSPALSIERQLVIIATLRGKLGTNEDSSARVLLRELRDRQDITYTNALDIDRLLATAAPTDLTKHDEPISEPALEQGPPSAATAPVSAPVQPPVASPAQAPVQPPAMSPPYQPPTSTPQYRPAPPMQQPTPQPNPQPTPQPMRQFVPPTQQSRPPMRPPQTISPQLGPQPGPRPSHTRGGINPITWCLLGAGVLLALISLFVADWISATGPGGTIGYDYGEMSSKVGQGDTGLSVVYFGWLGYILIVGTIVLSGLAALLPGRKKPILIGVVALAALTLLLTITSMVGEVGRINDKYGSQGVSGGYSVGFWLGMVAIVLFAAAPFIPRRKITSQ